MKIAICDFELRTLELIKNFVADTDTLGVQPFKILSYENPFDMLAYYSRYRDIDIILLNVEMKSGYDVAKELRKLDKKVEIIFLGKTTKMAVKGYSVNASYYLLKPIQNQVLQYILNKSINNVLSMHTKFFWNKSGERVDKIYYFEIKWIETYQRKTLISTINGKYISGTTMKEHIERLHNSGFVQVHSSYIVNLEYIRNITGNTITLRDGEIIPISKKRKREFLNTIEQFYNTKIVSL